MEIVYANKPETVLRATRRSNGRKTNHVLLGTWLEVHEEEDNWLFVHTRKAGQPGWVRRSHVRSNPALKVFYVDVGQGDGAIIESPEGITFIDGGPGDAFYRFVTDRYKPIVEAEGFVNVKAMIVSHPDQDHYQGFTHVLNSKKFKIEKIYHNGIIRYKSKSADWPSGANIDLGTLKERTVGGKKCDVLTTTFSTLAQAKTLVDNGFLSPSFKSFWKAAIKAKERGDLGSAKRLTSRAKTLPGYGVNGGNGLHVEVLGPVPTRMNNRVEYVGFPTPENLNNVMPSISSSHTRNGHSIVLKLKFGHHTFLMGGDLNIPAQIHLIAHHGTPNVFEVDVAKACHHGSSDFLVEFLKGIKPHVNVVSSGDQKSFDHPMADALGAMAKHTKGSLPLLFSTELARAISLKSRTIHYGLINARSNGDELVLAQMKEQHSKADVWDSFTVPWKGKFVGVNSK